MRHENLHPAPIRVENAHVKRIPMPETRGIEPGPVMVDGASPVSDLIFTVAVHVSRHHRVGTLPGVTTIPCRVGIEHPTLGELSAAPIPRHQGRAGVITTAEDGAGMLSV